MLSRTAQYAIRSAILLASESSMYHGAGEIALRITAPPNYTSKILKTLADTGVLVSTRGTGGGFKLARPASDITIYEIVEPIDKVSRWTKCFLGLDDCSPERPCPIHEFWKPIRDQYFSLLTSRTIADLLKNGGHGEFLPSFSDSLIHPDTGETPEKETAKRYVTKE
ncbi:MAG: Rrf2 family transcriptional regulator [Spirochaetales bacterium]|nr:Rrf2 family transcriptional regulator [Spirochaetales bacterium]